MIEGLHGSERPCNVRDVPQILSDKLRQRRNRFECWQGEWDVGMEKIFPERFVGISGQHLMSH